MYFLDVKISFDNNATVTPDSFRRQIRSRFIYNERVTLNPCFGIGDRPGANWYVLFVKAKLCVTIGVCEYYSTHSFTKNTMPKNNFDKFKPYENERIQRAGNVLLKGIIENASKTQGKLIQSFDIGT